MGCGQLRSYGNKFRTFHPRYRKFESIPLRQRVLISEDTLFKTNNNRVSLPDASVALQAHGGAGSDRAAPSTRHARAPPNSSLTLRSLGSAALDLALALVVGLRVVRFIGQRGRGRFRKRCGGCLHQAGVQLGLAFADCPPRRGHSNSKPSCRVRRHRIPSVSLGRRELERAEAEPNPGRTNSLQHGCRYLGAIVRQTRANSAQISPSGTGGSNPPLSANESLSVYIGPEMIEIRAPCGLIHSARGSGERDQSCRSPIRPDSSLFRKDSVPRADSVRSRPDASPFARSMVLSGRNRRGAAL